MTGSDQCLFCDIIEGKAAASVVFEDDLLLGILVIRPQHVGHTLLLPKQHVEEVVFLDEGLRNHLFGAAARLQSVISTAISCQGFQILLNQGPATGQKPDCRHLHVHLLPRSAGAAVNFDARPREVPREELDATARTIAGQIREAGSGNRAGGRHMRQVSRATPDQADRLFEIMVRATQVGCAPFYPAEVIAIWHEGRSAEGMAEVIARGGVYSLADGDSVRGFVHISGPEVVGLFVHPQDHGKGYGTELFRFAIEKIGARPILVMATLNAVPFYAKLGCSKVATESVRRHGQDIYVERMELV